MATWKLSPQYKKSAVEKMFFYKDGKCITIEQGFRWASFTVQSDERPLTDEELKNEDGYELSFIENDESWEMWEMMDGCWLDIEAARDNTTSTDVEEFEAAWEEDSYEGVEALGWSQDDTEYYYYGPLELTNEDTGEVFQGEPDEDAISISGVPVKTDEQLKAELDELIATMPKVPSPGAEPAQGTKWPFSPPVPEVEDPELTDWFPVDVNPVRKGFYEVLTKESINWPFPNRAEWTGKKWVFLDHTVEQWRGLAKDPSQ
jgi:hypothetical protein